MNKYDKIYREIHWLKAARGIAVASFVRTDGRDQLTATGRTDRIEYDVRNFT